MKFTAPCLLALLLCPALVSAAETTASSNLSSRLWQVLDNTENTSVTDQERSILAATLALQEHNHHKALTMLSANPDIQQDPLVNLLKAEAYRRSALEAVSSAGGYAKHQQRTAQQLASVDLSSDLSEATVRLQAFSDKVDGVVGYPLDLLLLSDEVQSVFLVDKARSRMFVYQRDQAGEMQRVADEYVVTGAQSGDKQHRGDARTPNGIYRFTEIRHDHNLTAQYGPVVFPIDYPNALDQLHGKSGDGIWMHGYSENVSRRQPQDTRGCFALPNSQLLHMEKYVVPHQSVVIIGEQLAFNQAEQQQALLQSVQQSLDAWQRDWQSLDSQAYLSHYHDHFRSGKYNLKRWKSYKTRVNRRKSFIRVEFSQLSILHDPNPWAEGEVVVVDMQQHYTSSNYTDQGRKRLYLSRQDAQQPWKILIEESLKP